MRFKITQATTMNVINIVEKIAINDNGPLRSDSAHLFISTININRRPEREKGKEESSEREWRME